MAESAPRNGLGQIENELRCTIKNVVQFKTCLESVKFPTAAKNKYMDVILQAH